MDDLIPPEATATAVPAADVTAPASSTGPVIQQAFPLRQPEEDAKEIVVYVRGSVLRRTRSRLMTLLNEGEFHWSEALLSGATLALGGTLGAIASGLPWAVLNEGLAKPTDLPGFFGPIVTREWPLQG